MTEKYKDASTSVPRGATFYRETKQKAPLALNILIWVITGIIISIILTNVKPYEIIATRYLAGISYSSITEFISNIWVIGAIFGLLLRFANFGLGFLLWAFIQILEVIPMELLGHEKFLDQNIKRGGGNVYADSEKDSWEVKLAKNFVTVSVPKFYVF